MQLSQVKIRRFRGFRDFTVNVAQFTNFVGQNSRGKTTILQAIKFVFDTVDRARLSSNTNASHLQFDSSSEILRLTLTDRQAVWHGKDTSQPFEIELTFDNGYRLHLENPAVGPASLVMFRGDQPIPALTGPEWKELGEVASIGAEYIPPIGATSGLEQWQSFPKYEAAMSKGLHSEVWRNSLYWQYNDGNKTAFDDAVNMVKQYIPVEEIKPPRQGHENQPSVVVEYVENEKVYDIGLSGSGMRSLLNLATVLMLTKSHIVMLDEPDAHLHSSLQRAVSRMVQDFAYDRGVQVLVATHAPDFISECDVESITWVDKAERTGRQATELSKVLVDLGSIKPSEAFDSNASSKLLFVEGGTDKRILGALLQRIDPQLDINSVRIAKLPSGKSSAAAVPMAAAMLSNQGIAEFKVACLVDRDWEIREETEFPKHVFELPVKEIENVLLDSDAVSTVVTNELSRRNREVPSHLSEKIEQIVQKACELERANVCGQLRWRYRKSLSSSLDPSTKEQKAEQWFEEKWSDLKWRLQVVGGKKVLKTVRRQIQKEFGVTITTSDILEGLSQVPDQLCDCLKKVAAELRD
jgi:ABC-type transport system involved in cytochrome c biogenesis ATPase subunit